MWGNTVDPKGDAGSKGASSRQGPARWFLEPPYPGAWVAGIVILLLAVEALVLNQMWGRRGETMAAAPVTAPVVVTPPAAAPIPPPQEEARVRVRDLPPRPQLKANVPAASGNVPSVVPPGLGNVPGNVPILVPGSSQSIPPVEPEPAPTPEPIPEPAPAAQPALVPVAPAAPPRPRPRPVPAPVPAPQRVREAGRLSLYFDADSSTFARHHERMPLRVEVYVDGSKRVDSTDPEKREFSVGQLRAGRHEVRIVPYVGDYPSEPFVGEVRVAPGEASTYKAVLRKAHDISRIAKFEPRD